MATNNLSLIKRKAKQLNLTNLIKTVDAQSSDLPKGFSKVSPKSKNIIGYLYAKQQHIRILEKHAMDTSRPRGTHHTLR